MGPAAGGHPEDELGDPETVARTVCLRLLERSPRTRAELAETLSRRGVPGEVVDGVLDRFTEVGLVDDQAFARAWVDSRQRTRGLAARALAGELHRRGVAREVVEEALLAVAPEEEELAARQLVRRKMRTSAGLEPTARARRLLGVLARKGYSGEIARRVVRSELDGLDGDPEP